MLMKWLAAVLCLLAFQATAQDIPEIPHIQDPETQVIPMPMQMQCTRVLPDQMLDQMYNESVFLWGQGAVFIPGTGETVGGEMRLFAAPEEKTYTVVLQIGELSCLVISGNLEAMFAARQKL